MCAKTKEDSFRDFVLEEGRFYFKSDESTREKYRSLALRTRGKYLR